jgi:hypothetical protein
MKVELLYFDGCPSYRTVQRLLDQVLAEEGIAATVAMVRIEDEADALRQQFLGSPTLRFDGVDPFAKPGQDNFAMQCRVYHTPEGLKGWPTKEMLRTAVRESGR